LPVLTRKEQTDPSLRSQALLGLLVENGELSGAIRIPHSVAPIHITADLRAGRITCHIDVDAPKEGRPATRVNWLMRQLKAAPDGLRLEAFVANARGVGATELLGKLRDEPGLLITDPKREIRTFRIALSAPMGLKRGTGRGAFIDSVLALVDAFYGEVVQDLKTWSAAPPRMREAQIPVERPADLSSTALSSQDGPEAVSEADVTELGSPPFVGIEPRELPAILEDRRFDGEVPALPN
jgi:hypothetical protein